MNLFFLRHGIAVERGSPGYRNDADRPLTPKGERQMHAIAQILKSREIPLDLILSSPYERAARTAAILAQAFGAARKLQLNEDLTPGGNPKKLIAQLHSTRPRPDHVWLVGHEPYLSTLISILTTGNAGLPIVLKKGGLCRLQVDSLTSGRCAELKWLVTPRLLGIERKAEP